MSDLIDRANKRYGEPQAKLKANEPETRIVASCFAKYAKGGKPEQVTWLHPSYPEIYARDIARGNRSMLDSGPSE